MKECRVFINGEFKGIGIGDMDSWHGVELCLESLAWTYYRKIESIKVDGHIKGEMANTFVLVTNNDGTNEGFEVLIIRN